MNQAPLDLSRAFVLEPHGPDTFIGESPPYPWGRIYGGLVVAQALWAATLTVREEHPVHSLHAYFILGGDPAEPVRYEVDRLRNGRSFTTRQVTARQSGGAILTLTCSFQGREDGPQTQSPGFPKDIAGPETVADGWGAGVLRRDILIESDPPRSLCWAKFPHPLEDDPRLHACALAYLSDLNPMSAIARSHPAVSAEDEDWPDRFMSASIDHAMWFHRPVRADDWLLIEMNGHGMLGTLGLATGPVFSADGTHLATVAQEGLMRGRRGQD